MEVVDNVSSKIVNVYDYFANYFLLFVFVAIIVYASYNYLGSSDIDYQYGMETSSNSFNDFGIMHIIISVIITIITLWVFMHIINHIFGINIIHIIKTIFSNKKVDDIIDNVDNKIIYAEDKIIGLFKDTKQDVKEIKNDINTLTDNIKDKNKEKEQKENQNSQSEVFNISNNKYTYDDAKHICSAYNSRLATYKEIEDSYNAGGEWCNYGWSENQLALFPTQESTYNKLKNIKGHENDCGRPGVNGGYIGNGNIKFGVNCYGVKPNPSDKEKQFMSVQKNYPKNQKDVELEKRVDYWKDNLDKLTISAFNNDKWSRV